MVKTHDVTKLKAWPKLKELGFKRIKFTFQGLAYSYGAEAVFKTSERNSVVITLSYWNSRFKDMGGLDIRFQDHTWGKSCRYSISGKKLTKELELLIWKIEHSEKFTKNLHEINY